jgi:hypothetical protein
VYLWFVFEHTNIILTKYYHLFLLKETFLILSSNSSVNKPHVTYLNMKTVKLHLTPNWNMNTIWFSSFSLWYLTWLILPSRKWRHVLSKRRMTFNVLQCVISEEIELFLDTPVSISNRIYIIDKKLNSI